MADPLVELFTPDTPMAFGLTATPLTPAAVPDVS
jgi:hypothetical protein